MVANNRELHIKAYKTPGKEDHDLSVLPLKTTSWIIAKDTAKSMLYTLGHNPVWHETHELPGGHWSIHRGMTIIQVK